MRANHKTKAQTMKDLDRELKQIKGKYHNLRDGNEFVLWFAEARITGKREDAYEGIIGQPGDTGVDAVYVDEGLRLVHLVQGKYVKPNSNNNMDLLKFGRDGSALWASDYKRGLESMQPPPAPNAKERLLEAHARLRSNAKPPFALKMYFATTGRVTPSKEKEAKRIAQAPGNTELTVVTGHDVPALFYEWQVGACPPLPEMEIAIDGQDKIFYQAGSLQGWIFTAASEEICRLYRKAKERLFARNIRGYRGDTTINDAILKSAKRDADQFWFMNNGITIVADKAESRSSGGEVRMHMLNPQVVNGQQTIRSLDRAPGNRAKVLVRVIQLDNQGAAEGFSGLVGEVVRATNRQNAVGAQDLMANDPEQVRIEREFSKLDYAYERKKQARREFAVKAAQRRKVKREELANAIASTTLGSHTVRRPDLWETQYNALFDGKRPVTDYLARWWAAKQVSKVDSPLTKEARWVVLACLWRWPLLSLDHCLLPKAQRLAFIEACQKEDGTVLRPLRIAAKQLFTSAKPAYVKAKKTYAVEKKKEGEPFKVLIPDAYFRQKGAEHQVLKGALKDSRRKRKVTLALKRFKARLIASMNHE
jgi:hypothetical protein